MLATGWSLLRVSALLSGLLLLVGCGWYYLDADPNEVPLRKAAPEFSLPSAGGGEVRLSGLRSQGNVVLVFYRGHW